MAARSAGRAFGGTIDVTVNIYIYIFAGIETEKAAKGCANPGQRADSLVFVCPVRYTQISTAVRDLLKGIEEWY